MHVLGDTLAEIAWNKAGIIKEGCPVISNVTGKPHSSDPGEIKAMMLEQVTGTTNWAADVEAAKSLGCTGFVEFGPGKVLSGLVKKIDASLATLNVADIDSASF